MRSTAAFGAAILFFASSSLAIAPSEFKIVARDSEGPLAKRLSGNEAPKGPPRQPKQPKQPKQPGGGRDGSTGANLGSNLIQMIDDITASIAADKDRENIWVGTTVDQLMAKNPTKNVLIYHNQDSKMQLQGSEHTHYELPLQVGFGTNTKGYEIHLFDSGWFELAGDGGYLNVGYGGCFNNKPRGNAHVEFATRTKKCPW